VNDPEPPYVPHRASPPSGPVVPGPPQPQPSGSWRVPDARLWFSDNGPVWVRLVWSGRSGEIEEVRVRNVKTQAYSSVRPTERLAADIGEAFARFVAEDIVAAVCPASGTGMGPPVSGAELLDVTEGLLDPRLLVAEVVRLAVQVAAVHAGIPPFVARLMGQAAGDLFTKLAGPDPDASQVQAVQYVDFALSAAENGSLISRPALPQIAAAATANAINKPLGPDAPESPSPAVPASAPLAAPAGFPAAVPASAPLAAPAGFPAAKPASPSPGKPASRSPAKPGDPRSHPPTPGGLGPRFRV
jgi:hypothetical protein